MSIIPRRSFLKGILASPLAALGLGRAKAATDAILVEGGLSSLRPVESAIGRTAFLEVFSGPPPLPGMPPTGTLLYSLPFDAPDEPVGWVSNLPGMEGAAAPRVEDRAIRDEYRVFAACGDDERTTAWLPDYCAAWGTYCLWQDEGLPVRMEMRAGDVGTPVVIWWSDSKATPCPAPFG